MMSPDQKILAIANLKTVLAHQEKKPVTGDLYERLDRILDDLLLQAIGQLSQKPLKRLLEEIQTFAPAEFTEICDTISHEQRIKDIKKLRTDALRQGAELDLGSILAGYGTIPLKFFEWEKTCQAFTNLVDQIEHANYSDLASRCEIFFDTTNTIGVPAGFPQLSNSLIGSLAIRKLLPANQPQAIIDDIRRIKNAVKTHRENMTAQFLAGKIPPAQFRKLKNDAYKLLHESAYSPHMTAAVSIDKYLVAWDGPGKAALLEKWWNRAPTLEKAALLTACTGVTGPKQWDAWVSQAKRADQTGRAHFLGVVKKHRFFYDLGFILSCRHLSGPGFDNIWLPVFTALQESLRKPSVTPAPGPQPDPKTGAVRHPKATRKPTSSLNMDDDPPEIAVDIEWSDAETDAGIDDLAVGQKAISKEDKIVAAKSTWNRYLKPFLSENLIGVLGAGLLMLAWLCISIWVWDKGQYYRMITGALPMFMTTCGLGWIAGFFHRNLDRGVSSKAPLLFSALSILSIPFNYLIALSIFLMGSPIGYGIGILMTALYTGTIFRITTWTEPVLNFSPGKHLVEINAYILLPVLAMSLGTGRFPIAWSPDIVLFLSFFALARVLHRPRKGWGSSFRLRFFLLGGNGLLVMVVFCIFLRATPGAGSMAVLLQLAALFFASSTVFAEDGKKIIISTSLTLAGLLLAVSTHSNLLPVGLVLAAALWMKLRPCIRGTWPDELIAGLIYMICPAIIFVNGIQWQWAGFVIFPLVAAVVMVEKKYLSPGLKVVSWSFPAVVLLLAVHILKTDEYLYIAASSAMAVVLCLYSYCRFRDLYQTGLWFLNLALLMLLPAICVAMTTNANVSLALLGFSVCLWAGVSTKLTDVLAYQYRNSLLFVFTMLLALLFTLAMGLADQLTLWLGICFLLTATALSVGAYRSGSQLPVYAFLVCAGIFSYSLVNLLGVEFKSGLGTASTSVMLLLFARLLNHFGVWQSRSIKEKFFGGEIPLRTTKFLVHPLETAAWIAICLGFFKATTHFTFIFGNSGFNPTGLKIAIAHLISTYMAIEFVARYRFKHSGFIALAPALLLHVNVCSAIAGPWLPAFIFLSLLGLNVLVDWLETRAGTLAGMLTSLKAFMQILTWLAMPAGLMIYAYYFSAGYLWEHPSAVCLSAILAIAFNHATAVTRVHPRFTHLVVAHLALISIFAYMELTQTHPMMANILFASNEGLYPAARQILSLAMVLACIFLIPGIFLESQKNTIWQAYAQSFHEWLLATAILFAGLVTFGWLFQYRPLPLFYYFIGFFLVHAGNRYYFRCPPVFIKAGLCIFAGLAVGLPPIFGMMAGIILFSLLEYGLWQADRRLPFGLQSVFPTNASPGDRAARVYQVFIVFYILSHLYLFLTDSSPTPHYLMYLLIPFSVFVYRRFTFAANGYLATGLFFYTNCFVSMLLLNVFQAANLNTLHLLSIAITLSILICYGYDAFKRRRRSAESS